MAGGLQEHSPRPRRGLCVAWCVQGLSRWPLVGPGLSELQGREGLSWATWELNKADLGGRDLTRPPVDSNEGATLPV